MIKKRMRGCDRRQALIIVVRDLFAQKGFDGVSTRELANAAGVPQSLIYKHFPSKQSLYDAMLDECIKESDLETYKKILTLEPSTSTLILIVHFLMSKMLGDPESSKALDMMTARSLIESGEFFFSIQKLLAPWNAKVEESLKAAVKSGDAEAVPSTGETAPLFIYGTAAGVGLFLRPEKKILDLKVSREHLIEKCVWFVLLGVGVKADVIRRHYNPIGLMLMTQK
jgi:AcrR family transcriptional regulator